ncbi:MAG: phosphate/phosphite/phosphonate ABC transporter substrate-binding protein [Deltaproteobacteria bacterium]|nr:phosphate/phosphite/phosphonate ABC transporter substrate-binding protein [Deltaproteobacteria bacterium]
MNLSRLVALLATALLVGCAGTRPAQKPFDLPAAPPGTLTVGLIVSSGTTTAQEQAEAMAKFVANATGQQARPMVFPDYDTLATFMADGKVDVAFLAPMAYVRATALGKVQPLLKVMRAGQATYRSVLFTGPAGTVRSLEDLKKARELRAAWVDPSSATGYIFAKALLLQNDIDPAGIFKDQLFLQSHDAVCKAIAEGRADVGASYSTDPASAPVKSISGCNTLGAQAGKLQIVAATEAIPNDVLAVREAFPAEAKAALLAAAQELERTEEGKKTLATAFHGEGFTTVSDDDYAPVRAALLAFKR